MFLIVRLCFAAAVAVTLGFAWTVGQNGLKQTNRNLCELWASLPLWHYERCEFQYVLVGLWLIAAIATVVWVLIEIITRIPFLKNIFVKLLLSVGPAWKYCTSWAIGHVRKLEPLHLIMVGLLIAVIGIGWQLYRGSPAHLSQAQIDEIAGPLQAQINALQKQLSQGPQKPTTRLGQVTAGPDPPKRRLALIDYEERRRILTALFKQANGPIRDTYGIAWGLYNDQPHLINTNQKPVFLELKKIRQQLISEHEELSPLIRAAELYQDIKYLNWNFNSTLLESLNELINKLEVPVANGQTIFIDSKETDKLRAGIDALGQWIGKTKQEIERLRSDDDNAEIYRSEKAP